MIRLACANRTARLSRISANSIRRKIAIEPQKSRHPIRRQSLLRLFRSAERRVRRIQQHHSKNNRNRRRRNVSRNKRPASAPTVVATSKNIPTRIFEYPSRKYAAAAPEEVAITDTSDAPIAYRISTPNTSVSSGTITTPPPSPVSDPSIPAKKRADRHHQCEFNRIQAATSSLTNVSAAPVSRIIAYVRDPFTLTGR